MYRCLWRVYCSLLVLVNALTFLPSVRPPPHIDIPVESLALRKHRQPSKVDFPLGLCCSLTLGFFACLMEELVIALMKA